MKKLTKILTIGMFAGALFSFNGCYTVLWTPDDTELAEERAADSSTEETVWYQPSTPTAPIIICRGGYGGFYHTPWWVGRLPTTHPVRQADDGIRRREPVGEPTPGPRPYNPPSGPGPVRTSGGSTSTSSEPKAAQSTREESKRSSDNSSSNDSNSKRDNNGNRSTDNGGRR